MKNIINCCIAFLISVFMAHAQDFQGVAVYESKTSMDDLRKMDNKDITPEMQKMIEEQMKKIFEKTFVLKFDKTASVYNEEEKLDAPGQENNPFKMISSFTGGGKQYKNIKEKRFLNEKELFGKEFLIDDSLQKIDWKMENETKKIGNYTCYKATAVLPVDESNLMNFRPKKGVDQEKVQKATNFTDVVEIPKDIIVTAWYTPEIPVSQGPGTYWGLPGLILEVSDGKTMLLCSKVVLNPKEKSEIKPLKNGTKVSRNEYAEIQLKKIQEMQEMYQTQGGGNRTFRLGN